jgi:hypothetical protein
MCLVNLSEEFTAIIVLMCGTSKTETNIIFNSLLFSYETANAVKTKKGGQQGKKGFAEASTQALRNEKMKLSGEMSL